jgi:hypothetical protein
MTPHCSPFSAACVLTAGKASDVVGRKWRLHARELEIISMIYCNVMALADLKALMTLDG